MGQAVAGVGDVDGDGRDDLVAGVYGADWNGHNSGGVQALSGLDGAPLYRLAGEEAGALLGFAVAALSDYDGDGVTDFAVGAPYFSSGSGGFFAGKVYVVSGAHGTVLDHAQGRTPGSLFGSALAGVDLNGDGRKELLVSELGSNGNRGRVRRYEWLGSGLASAGAPFAGRASGEFYGYSLANLGQINLTPGHEFAVGAPFADDGGPESGAVDVRGRHRSLFGVTLKAAGAHLGVSLASGRDLSGDGSNDFAAGAPDAGGTGQVLIWNTTPAHLLLTTVRGQAAGDRFGASLALIRDANFDGYADLAVGAPYQDGAGVVSIYDVVPSGGALLLHTIHGSAGSRMGWSVAAAGDINGAGVESLAVGAPYAAPGGLGRAGRVEAWTPPDTSLPPPAISLDGPLIADTEVAVRVENVKEGATVYFYAGRNSTPSVSSEGYDLDISGRLTGSGPLEAFAVLADVSGGTAVAGFHVPFPSPGSGTRLHFEAVEVRNGFVRDSDEASDVIQPHPFSLEMEGTFQVGERIRQHVRYGNANKLVYYYYSQLGPGGERAPDGGWNTGLDDPLVWPGGGSPNNADGLGEAFSSFWTLPAAMANRTLYFQAFSFQGPTTQGSLSNIESALIAP